jgi:hypothetical protein
MFTHIAVFDFFSLMRHDIDYSIDRIYTYLRAASVNNNGYLVPATKRPWALRLSSQLAVTDNLPASHQEERNSLSRFFSAGDSQAVTFGRSSRWLTFNGPFSVGIVTTDFAPFGA